MEQSTFEHEIIRILHQLPMEDHKQVLDFVYFLHQRQQKGASGQSLLTLAGSLPADQLDEIEQAIQEGCEQIDADAW